LRRLFFPDEEEPVLRRKSGGGGHKGKAPREDPRELPFDVNNNAGAVAVMDERTREEAFDLLRKMLTFDPEQRSATFLFHFLFLFFISFMIIIVYIK
jgi:hypothetical protein